MGKGQQDVFSRYIRMTFNVGTVGDLTDGQLLERFTAQGGETAELAFTALVERHGPMVLRVCRSVLRDPDEAHDAFQATFLVLVRRAGSLWVRDSLGPWLHQVAYRVASCARSAAARRRRHERRAAELAGPAVCEESRDDLGDVLHDEVNRLPWGCRAAVILCYFEGLSPEQAARQLGCPVGTVQSRLARGRERLRSRLTRRGLAPAVGALGAGVAAEAPGSPPAALVEATIQAALPLAAAGVVSGSVIQLTQGVLRSMFLIKFADGRGNHHHDRRPGRRRTVVAAQGAGSPAGAQPGPDPGRAGSSKRGRRGPAQGARRNRHRLPRISTWIDVAPADRLRVIEQLAAQSKGNYEKIKTWQGAYSYVLRQYLDEKFVASFLPAHTPSPSKPGPQEQEPGR